MQAEQKESTKFRTGGRKERLKKVAELCLNLSISIPLSSHTHTKIILIVAKDM